MLKYVEFARPVHFRQDREGTGVNLTTGAGGGKALVITDRDWDLEITGGYLHCRHKETGCEYQVPTAGNVLIAYRGVNAEYVAEKKAAEKAAEKKAREARERVKDAGGAPDDGARAAGGR